MLKRSLFAALLLPLAFATPAFGQAADGQGSRRTAPPPQTDIPAWARGNRTIGDMEIRAENQGGRKRVVGAWELAENVDLGVGLFEVQHKNPLSRRERVDPMADVLAPDQKIAAVGLSFRF